MIQKVSIQPQIKYQNRNQGAHTDFSQPRNAIASSKTSRPAFKGVESMLASGANSLIGGGTWGLQQCNVNPMFGVSLIDCLTAIFPRTWGCAKTNGFASSGTFRRE